MDDVFDQIFRYFDSQVDLARSLGVSPQAVHHWRRRRHIPARRALAIERLTDRRVTRHDMRPDLWPEARTGGLMAREAPFRRSGLGERPSVPVPAEIAPPPLAAPLADPRSRLDAAISASQAHGLSGTAASVLRHLAVTDDGHGCAIGTRSLADALRIQRNTVRRAIDDLSAAGLIRLRRKQGVSTLIHCLPTRPPQRPTGGATNDDTDDDTD